MPCETDRKPGDQEAGASPCCGESAAAAGVYNAQVGELVAIGAAIAANCEPCFKYRFAEARKLGVTRDDVAKAVAMAQSVKEAPAKAILNLAAKILGQSASTEDAGAPPAGACCGSGATPAASASAPAGL